MDTLNVKYNVKVEFTLSENGICGKLRTISHKGKRVYPL